MADLCVCRHEEREHAYDPVESRPVCFGASMACECARYTRSPLSAFRGPAVVMSRAEAAGWLRVISPYDAHTAINGTRREIVRSAIRHTRTARWCVRNACQRDAALHYLAARILRAVRP